MRWDSDFLAGETGASPGWWTGFFLRSTDGISWLLAHGPVTTVTCVPTSLYCDLVLRQLNVEGCQDPRRGPGKCCFGNTAVWERLSFCDRAFGEILCSSWNDFAFLCSFLWDVKTCALLVPWQLGGLLSSLVPFSVFIVLWFSQGYWALTESAICDRLWTFDDF